MKVVMVTVGESGGDGEGGDGGGDGDGDDGNSNGGGDWDIDDEYNPPKVPR